MDNEKNFTILIADDDKYIRDMLEKLLSGVCCVVLKAKSGEEALIAIKEGSIDIAILDVYMEGMTGIDVLKETKNLNIDIPVIIITGDESMDTERRVRENNVYAYFTKPIELEILKKTVLSALNRGKKAV